MSGIFTKVLRPQFAKPYVAEMQTSVLRAMILAALLVCGLWVAAALVVRAGWWSDFLRVTLVVEAIGVASGLALALADRQRALAAVLWLGGLAGAIALAVVLFAQPMLAVLLMLLPVLAVVTLNLTAGVLAEGAVVLLVFALNRSVSLPDVSAPLIILGGALALGIGAVLARQMAATAQASHRQYEQARRETEEARNQKLDLHEVQQDLIHVNRELARLSDQLKVSNQVAEEARQVKEEFVANVSHELRTPLNMIIGFSEMIMQSPQAYGRLPATLLADIAAIERNSQHLSRLVDDVLDLSQIEAGRMGLNREWCDLGTIVDEAIVAVRALYDSKQLYLKEEVAQDLPQVFCDGTRVRQVLLNLLSNAGRFTDTGGVNIGVTRKDTDVIVTVADTGPGIAPEDQNRIFEPFQQADTSVRRKHGGSGLGLTISKRFVEMHGGKLWLDSTVGVGTSFHFSLPVEAPYAARHANAGSAGRWFNQYQSFEGRQRRFKAPVPVSTPKLIVLEKGNVLARLIGHHAADIEVSVVETIEAAVAEAQRSPAQAVIANIATIDEATLTHVVVASLPHGTLLVRCTLPGRNEAARDLGATGYIVKPIGRQTLLDAISAFGMADKRVQTVLLVDDDAEVLQLFTRMLSSAEPGYGVLQAGDGRRALDLMRERQPDLVLLDRVMPGMSGDEVLRQKALDPSIRDIPVLMISATDPDSEPTSNDTFTVSTSGGFSPGALLACLEAISVALSPPSQSPPEG